MLRKIELVSDKKIDNKTLNKIKGGGWCCCANCVCGNNPGDSWSDDNARTSRGEEPVM
jgi:hypothetical protein